MALTLTHGEFVEDVLQAVVSRPAEWRIGQTVFNYIDEKYGVARDVQFYRGIDCFYDDSKVECFIHAAYKELKKKYDKNDEKD